MSTRKVRSFTPSQAIPPLSASISASPTQSASSRPTTSSTSRPLRCTSTCTWFSTPYFLFFKKSNFSPSAILRPHRLPELDLPQQALALPRRAFPAFIEGVSLAFPPLRLAPRRLRQAASPARAPGLRLRAPLFPPPASRASRHLLPRGQARSLQNQRPRTGRFPRGTHLVLQFHRSGGPPVSPLRRLASPRRAARPRAENRGEPRPSGETVEPSRVALDNRGRPGPALRRFHRRAAAGGDGGNRGNGGAAFPVANVRHLPRLPG